jgi:hypothetical protein
MLEDLVTKNGWNWHRPITSQPSAKAEDRLCEAATIQASPKRSDFGFQRVGKSVSLRIRLPN